ncbi:MAG: RluA family pseudouridine synthase [Planctomycetes bacterium]|nr:RluA family pseudouridine synthase [Planctomycetota bacterium]
MAQKDYSQQVHSIDFVVHPTYKPLPLRTDLYLTARFPQRSRNQLQKLFKEKRVLVNGATVSASHKLRGGEEVQVLLPEDMEYIPPDAIDLSILYEDEDILVVNKAPNIMMHPAGAILSGTLLNAIHHYYEKKGDPTRPGLLQRLDKHTSGLLVVAKNHQAHQGMQEQITTHSLDKIYFAVCDGIPKEKEGFVEAPMGEVSHPFRKKMGVYEGGDSKEAKTQYVVLHSTNEMSLLGVKLHTGRQHQIRVHMAHIGHPLRGDDLYGGCPSFSRQALHSYYLGFKHPCSGKEMNLNAPLPRDLQELIRPSLEGLGSNKHKLDIHCIDQPWNPRIWLDSLHSS